MWGLGEHGLGEKLNDKGCGGEVHVLNETEPSPVKATGRGAGNGCVLSDKGASWDGRG